MKNYLTDICTGYCDSYSSNSDDEETDNYYKCTCFKKFSSEYETLDVPVVNEFLELLNLAFVKKNQDDIKELTSTLRMYISNEYLDQVVGHFLDKFVNCCVYAPLSSENEYSENEYSAQVPFFDFIVSQYPTFTHGVIRLDYGYIDYEISRIVELEPPK